MRQFAEVSAKYGAPMGRRSFGSPEGEIELFKVRFVDGDYDDGGAYWGGGQSLYCARNHEGTYQAFVRADNWVDAKKALHIDEYNLDERAAYLDIMIEAYLDCALWCESADDMEESWRELNYDPGDFSDDAWAQAAEDCEDLLNAAEGKLTDYWPPEDAGHNFWLTRNGHGTGFWDRDLPHGDALTELSRPYGSAYIYLDDDGLLHLG